jgi:RimJ/RimL family protein N-acetyltransferase
MVLTPIGMNRLKSVHKNVKFGCDVRWSGMWNYSNNDFGGNERAMIEPPVSGRKVFLRVVMQGDYETIRMVESSGDNQLLYRHKGTTPSPEEFVARLWAGVLAQFMVCENSSGRPVGIVAAYGADFRNGHAHLASIVFPDHVGLGWPLEGTELFIDYLFETFDFRKLYGETSSVVMRTFPSVLGDIGREEGRLVGHERFKGELVDKVILAIYREDWANRRQPISGPSKLGAALRAGFHSAQSVTDVVDEDREDASDGIG